MTEKAHRTGSTVRLLTIRTRLILAFGTLIVLLAAMAAAGAWRLAELDHRATEMATVSVRVERVLSDWLDESKVNMLRRLVVTRSEDAALLQLLTPGLAAGTKRINLLQSEVESLVHNPEGEALLRAGEAKRKAFLATRQAVEARKKAGDGEGAMALLDAKMVPAQDAYLEGLQAVRDFYTQQVERDATAATDSARSGRMLLAGFCVAGIVLALLASWLITRSILQPIDDAVRAARRVADGDLRVDVQTGGRDEMAQMLQAVADMTTRLRELVGNVAQGARTVADTSVQIAQGNVDLSQRTEEQASTLEETASSMEELTSTVSQNADNARMANGLAAGAAAVAREGGTAVTQVVATMNGISESSKKIAEIIGVIDGIAFQTNILALNAAVEAARAGEQGRGFAVVAAEVRTLAQRSAQAAKEIKALIGESVAQVEAGTSQVDVAGRKMQDIVSSVAKVSEIIAEIASASQEQSSGIEQINTAVTQMDQMVQQNASLVEEATAATESMKNEAQALLQAVGRFRLAQGDAVAPAAATIAPIQYVRRPAAATPGDAPAALLGQAKRHQEWRTF